MQKAFGSECKSKTRIKEWYKRSGSKTVALLLIVILIRAGLQRQKPQINIEQVRLAIEQDRRMTVRELEDLGIPKTIISEILTESLKIKRNI